MLPYLMVMTMTCNDCVTSYKLCIFIYQQWTTLSKISFHMSYTHLHLWKDIHVIKNVSEELYNKSVKLFRVFNNEVFTVVNLCTWCLNFWCHKLELLLLSQTYGNKRAGITSRFNNRDIPTSVDVHAWSACINFSCTDLCLQTFVLQWVGVLGVCLTWDFWRYLFSTCTHLDRKMSVINVLWFILNLPTVSVIMIHAHGFFFPFWLLLCFLTLTSVNFYFNTNLKNPYFSIHFPKVVNGQVFA